MRTFLRIGVMLAMGWQVGAYGQRMQYSNAFLSIGQDARDMGIAPGLIAFDSSGTYWNPANIGSLALPLHASFFHMMQYGGIANYNVATLRGHVAPQINASITYVRWGIDNIPNTLDLVSVDGQVIYEKVTSFSAADQAILTAIAYRGELPKAGIRYSAGVQAKMIFRKVGAFARARGYGLDVGAKAFFKQWRIGISLRDLTGTFNVWNYSFTEAQRKQLEATGNRVPVRTVETTPPTLLIGAGYQWDATQRIRLRPEAALLLPFDGRGIAPRLGMEVSYQDRFFFRAGLHRFQRLTNPDPDGRTITIASPAFGIGFVYDIFSIDYALADMGTASLLPVSHALSLRVTLRRPPSQSHHSTTQ